MKRLVTIAGLIVLAAAAVALVERVNEDRRYRDLLLEGERALDEDESYAAIEAFSGALALQPRSMAAYYRRGEAYASQGQVLNAVRDFRAARDLAPDAPQPLEALGQLFDERGEAAEAARWYQEAAELLGSADPPLLYSLALAHYRAGNAAAAMAPLRQAIAADDSLVRAHYLLGLVYRDARRFDVAVASLEHAIRLSPSFLAAREELADLYGVLGRRDDQIHELESLADDDPRLTRRLALADAQVAAGRHGAALATLAAAEAAAPGDARIGVALGRAYLARAEEQHDQTSVRRALAALEPAIAGTLRGSESLSLYGRGLFLAGDIARAEQVLLEATAASPTVREAYAFLADAAEQLGHPEVAERALRSLDALEGDTVAVDVRAGRHRRLGALALSAGNPDLSIRFLTSAIAAGRTDAATLGLLAQARWETADHAGARAALAQALAQAPTDPDLTRLAQTIR